MKKVVTEGGTEGGDTEGGDIHHILACESTQKVVTYTTFWPANQGSCTDKLPCTDKQRQNSALLCNLVIPSLGTAVFGRRSYNMRWNPWTITGCLTRPHRTACLSRPLFGSVTGGKTIRTTTMFGDLENVGLKQKSAIIAVCIAVCVTTIRYNSLDGREFSTLVRPINQVAASPIFRASVALRQKMSSMSSAENSAISAACFIDSSCS
jgi:hypothetical protein